MLTSKIWWKAAFNRAVRTMAQVAAGALGTGTLGLMEIDWYGLLSLVAISGMASI